MIFRRETPYLQSKTNWLSTNEIPIANSLLQVLVNYYSLNQLLLFLFPLIFVPKTTLIDNKLEVTETDKNISLNVLVEY